MSNGDFKPYKKGFGWKRFNRLLKLQRKYRVIPNRPGWEQTPDGIMPPPTPAPGTTTSSRYWNLTLSATTPGNVTLDAGTIIQDTDSISETVEITNIATEQTPSAGDVLYLEFTDISPSTCTVECSDTWADHPSMYEIDSTPEFAAYREPLWYFTSVSDGGISVAEDLYAVRVCGDWCFRVINTVYRENASGAPYLVPQLEPSFQALPASIT